MSPAREHAVFPTTMWSEVRRAGARDRGALEDFAARYRSVLMRYLGRRGLPEWDAEDLCQEILLKLIRGAVLANADPAKGRFRSLLLAVTRNTLADRQRARRQIPAALPDGAAAEEVGAGGEDPEFDHEWALHLAAAALAYLESEGSPYYAVLRDHLQGQAQDRNRLWLARRKLIARIRHEIAMTCASAHDFEDEVAYLSRFLRP